MEQRNLHELERFEEGKAKITSPDGEEITLEPGTLHVVDAECGLDPDNPFEEQFVMLEHRVKI